MDVYILISTENKKRLKKHLKKLKLKMELFTLQKDIILGFKTTIILDYNSMTPVAILIHPGAPPMIQDFF